MKEDGLTDNHMVRARKITIKGSIRGNISKGKSKDRVNLFGIMAQFIRVIFQKDLFMEKEFLKIQPTNTPIKASIILI